VEQLGVGTWIERRARIVPDAPALVVEDAPVSYAELALRIRRVANAFRQLGVAQGDRVVWMGQNHPAFLESFFGAALIGAALAPINHHLARETINALLADYEPALVVQHRDVEFNPSGSGSRSLPWLGVAGQLPGAADYEATVGSAPDHSPGVAVGLDDLCLLAHTSGTTSQPKGIMLSHANVTWNAINIVASVGLRTEDVTVAIAPFFRTGGVGLDVLPLLFLGGTVVLPAEYDPDGILAAMARHRVSIAHGNPDVLEAMLHSRDWPVTVLSTLRFIITGGAPVPERLIRAYLARGVTMVQGYGLSEAGPAVAVLPSTDALSRVGSAGKPLLMVDLRVVGPDDGDVAVDETGELHVRGPNVMAGYWRRPDATRTVQSAGGWLRTGDAARIDADGYVWIVGRMADAFESAGRLIHPGDIERLLAASATVADVAVVGLASADRVRLVAVAVRSGEGGLPPEVLGAAGVEAVVYVDELPRSSVGKLLRHELRALAEAALWVG
jgi:fatty-acyl-CoA synthase